VFRKSGLSDSEYADFIGNFGEIDLQRGPPGRIPDRRLGDPSNIDGEGNVVKKGSLQYYTNRATMLFHVDSPYDARRIRYTSIKAVTVLPPGTGGATEFADSRTAYEDLDEETKKFLEGKVGVFSQLHSRKISAPDFPTFQHLEPEKYFMGKHYIVQTHPDSGRKDLYIASHLHHIDGMDAEESWKLIERLKAHVSQDKYVTKVYYNNPTDFTIYDGLAVLHRAGGGSYVGKYARDLRRCTLYDNTPEEWGLNNRDDPRLDPGVIIREVHERVTNGKEELLDVD